jgi:site-specific DNA-methyltransferase (adenine-specific)
MRIDEATYKAMPPELQALFTKLPNPGSEEVVGLFPQSTAGTETKERGKGGIWSPSTGTPAGPQYGDSGSAARFFYAAKASRSERDAGLDDSTAAMRNDGRQTDIDNPYQRGKVLRNHHPTVKPVALMRWLCRLVTPPGGVVLDPFAGSGSTGVAAVAEGFSSILIERDTEYVEIIRRRIAHAQGVLFSRNDD